MNGDNMAARVRRLLRDVSTVTEQGEFWEDAEISVALNAAQMMYVNFALRSKQLYNLGGLFVSSGYIPSGTLPVNYLHYSSGLVGPDQNTLRLAMIYVGGMAEVYRFNSRQQAILIVGSQISFMDAGIQRSGILNYYKYPSYIGLTSRGENVRADFAEVDFAGTIYDDIIALWAAKILGMKEPQTQREFKRHKRVLYELSQYPPIIDNQIVGNDFKVTPKREKPSE